MFFMLCWSGKARVLIVWYIISNKFVFVYTCYFVTILFLFKWNNWSFISDMNFKKSIFLHMCTYVHIAYLHIFENILRKFEVDPTNSFRDISVFIRIFELSAINFQNFKSVLLVTFFSDLVSKSLSNQLSRLTWNFYIFVYIYEAIKFLIIISIIVF